MTGAQAEETGFSGACRQLETQHIQINVWEDRIGE